MSRQSEKSENTRAALVRAARELFVERGYAAVGTGEIVARAGSSRGAMYHHFADKKELFRAVYQQVQEELIQQVADRLSVAGRDDPVGALEEGLRTFLRGCAEPDKARIGLIEAPSVLGWQEWRALDEQYGLGLVTSGLQVAVAAGGLRSDLPIRSLAHIVLAGLGEAGMLIATADDAEAARLDAERAMLLLLDGLRP